MKVVVVTWFDAFSGDEWYTKSELSAKLAAQPKGEVTHSVGFLYEENDDWIALVQSEQPEEGVTEASIAGLLVIPKSIVDGNVEVLRD